MPCLAVNGIFQAVTIHTALSSCGRVSSLKLLSGSLLVSHRPCDRCYSCQPGTVHWGHAVIALDATLNGWVGETASWERGGEKIASGVTDIWPPLLSHSRCLVDKYWTFELSLLPPLDFMQLSFQSWAVISSWKKVLISGPETLYCQRDPENFLTFIK